MASEKEHSADCVKELGEPFTEVHQWLDELYPKLGHNHRSARHHVVGVEEVRAKWGDRAALAAEIHIMKDCYGKVPSKEEADMWDLFS